LYIVAVNAPSSAIDVDWWERDCCQDIGVGIVSVRKYCAHIAG
jgi:hypothetical protein